MKYKDLQKNDIIQEGDEFNIFHGDFKWHKIIDGEIGKPVGLCTKDYWRYRRPLKSAVAKKPIHNKRYMAALSSVLNAHIGERISKRKRDIIIDKVEKRLNASHST